MSAHGNFYSIGGQPPVPPPSLTTATGVDQVNTTTTTSSKEPSGVSAELPAQAAPEETDIRAQSIAHRLDALMLQAATTATQSLGDGELKDALDLAGISAAERRTASDALVAAHEKMRTIAQFTGRQIADALVKEGGHFKFDGGSPVATVLNAAIQTQGALAQEIRKLMDAHPQMSDAAYDRLMDLSLQCERRMTEINRLALQLANAATAEAGDAVVDEMLKSKLSALLPRQSLEMHGNADLLEKLKEDLEPLASRVTTLAADPDASISQAAYQQCIVEVGAARTALNRIADHGVVDRASGTRILPDRGLLAAAAKILGSVSETLSDAESRIGGALLKKFADRTFALGARFPQLAKANLPLLRLVAPAIAKAVELRENLREAALKYGESPNDLHLQMLQDCAERCWNIDTQEIKRQLPRLKAISGDGRQLPPCDDWDALRAGLCNVGALHTQTAHFVQMVKTIRDKLAQPKLFTSASMQALLAGRLEFPTLVEARVHGMSDDDVDPARDDSHVRESHRLSSGSANTVQLVSYDDGSEHVFKAEAAGRQGIEGLLLSRDYHAEQQMVQLNLATQDAAKALNLVDVVPKCSVGVHDGDYGLFMEKAPGMETEQFARATRAEAGHLTAAQVKALPPDQHARVIGDILRQTNRLEWLDLVTGQGDRHASNYMIDVRDDLTVTVKGIDNDECFPAFRTGLRTFVLDKVSADRFRKVCGSIVNAYPRAQRDQVRQRLDESEGVQTNRDGTITLDTSAFQAGELHYAALVSVGTHGATLPDYIDADLFKSLTDLKAGKARHDYIEALRARLPAEAVASADSRLDAAIALAEKLMSEDKVIPAEEFARQGVQRSLLARELNAPNPVAPVGAYSLPPNSDICQVAQWQTKSLFVRDLLGAVSRDDWFK